MKHPLHEEALWAANQTRKGRSPEDSALLFVSWNALDAQLDALQLAWGHSRINHAVAIKSQPHLSVLKHIVGRGFGLEAATIDGASRWQKLRYVTIPHLMPLFVFITLIHLMDAYPVF